MEALSSAIFQRLDNEKNARLTAGKEVYNFSIGTPDLKPAPHVVQAVAQAAQNPENYKYAVQDLPELQDAVIRWYLRRYGVSLSREMILALSGSQDGLAHIGLVLADPGSCVLVPDPGYPIFGIGPHLAGAKLVKMPLRAQNNYLIDFDEITDDVARLARFMIVSYPSNPVTAVAPDEFFYQLIDFARKWQIAVIFDNAYSEFVFDGEGKSFLSYPGAIDVGIELNSLSKSYNMSGCRIAFALGNPALIEQIRVLKSHLDYGIFLPVQHGAIAALNGSQEAVAQLAATYKKRMQLIVAGLNHLGWSAGDSAGTMFLWVPIPKGWSSDEKFAYELLQRTGVIVVPGSSFGEMGEGYVRFALVQPVEIIEQALLAMRQMNFS
jgi:LL-diaminopimelate aminotransferase